MAASRRDTTCLQCDGRCVSSTSLPDTHVNSAQDDNLQKTEDDVTPPLRSVQSREDQDGLRREPKMLEPTTSLHTLPPHTLSGIELRKLSAEATQKRRKQLKRNPTKITVRAGQDGDTEAAAPEQETVFVVGFESASDDQNPQNWSFLARSASTLLIASIGWTVGFASSVDSAAIPQAAADLGVSQIAESAATGLFLIGIAWGAMVAGPISEAIGRNPVYIASMAVYMIWIMASALAPNLGAQIIFRFLAGFFTATPMTCAGGSLSDLWTPVERGIAFPVFAVVAFTGPASGPIVGGFIAESSLVSWRWCDWVTLIISGFIFAMITLFQPETYAPVLMKWKAKQLRSITGDERYVSEIEIRAYGFGKRLAVALYRPFLLFTREPIVVFFALYLTVVYIILFTFLDGYTYIFGETYGFSQGFTGLAFLGMVIGILIAACLIPLFHHWVVRDLTTLRKRDGPGANLPPEIRLWFAMCGGPLIPLSLFWMAWTNYSRVLPWSDLVASVVFGFGIICIFISSYQYIIDSYEIYAASALVGLTLLRYNASGIMVVVGIP